MTYRDKKYSKVRRTFMSITPCKRSAARGNERPSILSELCSSSTLYGVGGCICYCYPELRTGLFKLNAFGVWGIANMSDTQITFI
jgi:hypothetical protein